MHESKGGPTAGLRDDGFERDACGVGFLAELSGEASARLLPLALTALGRMGHRGAVDADGRTGDGAGVTTQIPHAVLRADLDAIGFGQVGARDLAVGLVFVPRNEDGATVARTLVADALQAAGFARCGWRAVPIRGEVLGRKASRSRPGIVQVVVARPAGATDDEFEQRLYRARREATERALEQGIDPFAISSLSHRTLVYKALVRAVDLALFYPDLRHPAFSTAFALFHQRFSTNTDPSWALAQPFRLLAHNGEINTIQGNRLWMEARGSSPLMRAARSDSASLDEALGALTHGGRDVLHALSLLVPPAWETDTELAPEVRDFFDYQSCLMEPWDGPAMVVFTDGRVVGAALDRNGLRPARSVVTTDGLVLVASEAGVLDVPAERVLARDRLGPGDVVAVDLRARRLLDRGAIHGRLAARRPYGAWLAAHRVLGVPSLGGAPESAPASDAAAPDVRVLRAFGFTREEAQLILGPMFRDGVEPLGSMGDDAPLAVLSSEPRLLSSYFKQRFAQVTNPPIDPLRETLVMSLATHLGPRGDLLREAPEHAAQVHLDAPVLTEDELRALAGWRRGCWTARDLSLLFEAEGGEASFRRALDELTSSAEAAVRDGATLLVLSDRGLDEDRAALPSLLAVSAVHHHLARRGLRLRASLVVETGEARDDHQVAALLGFGAEAVCPYVALAMVQEGSRATGGDAEDQENARRRYLHALKKGIRKILSKMGISTLRSYHGAQLFEAVGIAQEVIDAHFTATPSLAGGLGLDDIARESLDRHRRAFAAASDHLDEGSLHRYRRNGEVHAFEPSVVKALHAAIRTGTSLDYKSYAALVHLRAPVVLRDLLEFRAAEAIPLDEVEPVEAILPRFMTSAMSLGALSPEAQQTLAIAMNRIGGRSNSGEGGEAPEMFSTVLPGDDRPYNKIKQVASARFGVTAEYLVAADELQIKMAQGSKPGEGGQLPGHKVAPHIARVRHAPEGATLISPPPHHDIYSIEDLAQLVYDLKQVNAQATVGVKLVAEAGVGTIAAGVAKAHADAIVVAGHDGGTGASPWSSIKNAGTPWELGLAEAQQVLVRQGLRERVRLQVEGGLKTGRDVVMAALLGADEYGFGSAALVAAGCVMARQCHLNTCPAGVATQREDLRQKFHGTPDDVVHFFLSIAEEVREILALLGQRRLADVVGRTDLLDVRAAAAGSKAATVTLAPVLAESGVSPRRRRHAGERNDPPVTGADLDQHVLARVRFGPTGPSRLTAELPVTNADRTVGARIAGEIARRYRGRTLRPATLRLDYRGSAGQSFGAFCVEGMQLSLDGEANDGVAKGMSGGEVVVRPFASGAGRPDDVIAGNAILYGATGGRLFMAGRAGERFAVRNSGALAVVEGAGDHACEYMTAGAVVILGATGRNLAAGMSGGLVYVLDLEKVLDRRLNDETAVAAMGVAPAEEAWLKDVIRRHAERTGSRRAREVLARWTATRDHFRRVTSRLMAGALPLPAVRPQRTPAPVSRRRRAPELPAPAIESPATGA
jgi:glutamate synthase domain-containing protein 2/glutamate synthase domain-containing protein 1/glutamate synthase domain-containing protein 3